MIDVGAFEDMRCELIDGELIDKMGQNPNHAYTIQLVVSWLAGIFGVRLIRVQSSILLTGADRDRSVPEPDVAVLSQWKDEYQVRHPDGNELVLAVEVASSSRHTDLGRKAELYANAGVPEYWVVDLDRRAIVVHRDPDGPQYRKIEVFPQTAFVSLMGRKERISVEELLPSTKL